MLILDGRNSHKIPEVIEINEPKIVGKWQTVDNADIYCAMLDSKYAILVATSNKEYQYICCVSYKRFCNVSRWIKQYYPFARQI